MRKFVAIVCMVFPPLIALADSWAPPTPAAVVSDKAAVIVRIDPGTNPGSGKPDKPAHCRFFRYDEEKKTYEPWKEFDLVNSTLPGAVVVPDDGSYLATFDDYMGIGTTKNAVVVYDAKGRVRKRWSIEDIYSKKEIDELPRTTMSIQWRGDVGGMAEHQQEIYISPPTDPLQSGKKFKGFMLYIKSLRIRVDPRWK